MSLHPNVLGMLVGQNAPGPLYLLDEQLEERLSAAMRATHAANAAVATAIDSLAVACREGQEVDGKFSPGLYSRLKAARVAADSLEDALEESRAAATELRLLFPVVEAAASLSARQLGLDASLGD